MNQHLKKVISIIDNNPSIKQLNINAEDYMQLVQNRHDLLDLTTDYNIMKTGVFAYVLGKPINVNKSAKPLIHKYFICG